MTRLFISYRRDDSGGHTGRLFDRLVARYGADAVFMDHYDLRAGADFEQAIDAALAVSDVVLAIIGPRWVDASDTDGRQRLARADDFVRRELLAAIEAGKSVIPVLVGGAALPRTNALPAELAALVRLQAVEIRDARFEDDVAVLIGQLPAPGATAMPPLAERLGGAWQAAVSYPWGVTVTERFVFEDDEGEVLGSGSFLTGSHPLEEVEVLGDGLRFTLHSEAVMGEERRRLRHRYRVRIEGDSLHVRLQSSGGFSDSPVVRFRARRVGDA